MQWIKLPQLPGNENKPLAGRNFHNVLLFLDINRGKKYTRRAPVIPLVLSMLELHRTVLWQRFWRDVIRSVWPVLTRFNFMPLMTPKNNRLQSLKVGLFYALSRSCDPILCGKYSRRSIAVKCCGNQNTIKLTPSVKLLWPLELWEKFAWCFFSSFLSVVVSFTRVRINGSLVKESCWLSHVYIKYRGQ